ncbi:hypothetical protein, partial [Streptosporangium sp. NPDC049644]|uniref:hypothetical protein n=1 Tax=Streptosporangium sp. NPDC049644 TaxID=3155507 RepID=UPI0034475BA8
DKAQNGRVLDEPFEQAQLNQYLVDMLDGHACKSPTMTLRTKCGSRDGQRQDVLEFHERRLALAT